MNTFKRLPTLTQLRHLVALDRYRHFGKAAEACFITQSSLSLSIRELESGLRAQLVERTRRSVMLTKLGEEIVRRALTVIADVASIAELAEADGSVLTGDLRLGVIPTIAPFLLPRTLPRLRASYPDLKLYLREGHTADLVRQLQSGDLDVLLLAFPYPAAGLQTLLFADDPFWVAYPHGQAPGNTGAVSRDCLKKEKLLVLEEGNCLRDHAFGACRLDAGSANVEFQASSLHTLIQMVDNGLGVTLIPRMAIDGGIAAATRTELRPMEGTGTSRQIGLAWRPTSARQSDFKLLAEFFSTALASCPPQHLTD